MDERQKRRIERRESATKDLLSRRGQIQGGAAKQPHPNATAASEPAAAAEPASEEAAMPATAALPSDTPAAAAALPNREPRLKSSEETMVFVIKTKSMREEFQGAEPLISEANAPEKRSNAPLPGDVFVIRTDSIRAKVDEPGKEESENVQEGSGVAQEDPGHQGQG